MKGDRNKSLFKGFTLVELLVVISIIALLLAIIVPVISKARDLAKRVQCMHDLGQLGVATMAYFNDYNRLWCVANFGYGGRGSTNYWIYTHKEDVGEKPVDYVAKNAWANHGLLLSLKYIPTAKIYYCPAEPKKGTTFETYFKNETGLRLNIYKQDIARSSYISRSFDMYKNGATDDLIEKPEFPIKHIDSRMAILADRWTYGDVVAPPIAHLGRFICVLYGDGHTDMYDDHEGKVRKLGIARADNSEYDAAISEATQKFGSIVSTIKYQAVWMFYFDRMR